MREQGWHEFLAAEGVEDWVVLHGGAMAVYRVRSLRVATGLADAIATIADVAGAGVLLTLADDRVTLRLTRDLWALESRHVALARAASVVARAHGAVPDRAAVQEVQLAIASKRDAHDVGFWRAVLGDGPSADDNAVDPLGHGSTVWMQELDERKALRHAMHVDVSVAREHVETRLKAALAAGGRVVDDSNAPSHWTLSDRAGNRVCICAWPDGSNVGPWRNPCPRICHRTIGCTRQPSDGMRAARALLPSAAGEVVAPGGDNPMMWPQLCLPRSSVMATAIACALCSAVRAPQAQYWPPADVQRPPARCNPARHVPYLQPSDTPTTAALSLDGRSDMAAALSRCVPGGYAGVWFDNAQRINVNLVDTADVRATLVALAEFAPAGHGTRGTVTREGLLAARTHAVRWTTAELEDWYGALAAAAIDLDSFGQTRTPDGECANAFGVIDVVRNQLVYLAPDTVLLARIDRTLSRQDLPCGLARLEVWKR